MKITKHFDRILDAPLHNARNSWGAITRDGSTVILRVWGNESVRLPDGRKAYLVQRTDGGGSAQGRAERKRHVALAEQGLKCELVICTAVDVTQEVWTIKTFGRDAVFTVTDWFKIHGDTFAVIGGYRKVG